MFRWSIVPRVQGLVRLMLNKWAICQVMLTAKQAMLPSSRTPEGEPLRCSICGDFNFMDVSRPPGDVVCPSCGSHAWISRQADAVPDVRGQIRRKFREFEDICRQDFPVQQVGDRLVAELVVCLAARGAMLWTWKKSWWSRRTTLRVLAGTGELDSPEFAEEVSAGKRELVRQATMPVRDALLIGVPVMHKGEVVGVIEVVQRTGSATTAQRGYLKFVMRWADTLSQHPALFTSTGNQQRNG